MSTGGMDWDAGTVNLSSAGTGQQIENSERRVKSLMVRARLGNTGMIYYGRSDVSSTNGVQLAPGERCIDNFAGARQESDGSVPFNTAFFDGDTTNDDIDWIAHLVT